MISDKCIVWGAGYCGGIALEAFGAEIVHCFGDSDPRNVGKTRWGKPIISYYEMIMLAKTNHLRIIAASEDYSVEMEDRLKEEGIENYDLFISEYAKDIIADRRNGINPLTKSYRGNVKSLYHGELKRFYNIHENRRIFLIGNGPSLKTSDLDILHINHEICFGFNNIHSIFERTDWRPDYYGIADYYGFMIGKEKLGIVPGIHFFWDLFASISPDLMKDPRNFFFRYIRNGYSLDEMPDFSNDVTNGLFLGYSATYDIGLQMAAFMGASEIYLIGMDHNQPNKSSHEGNHFEGYLSDQVLKDDKMTFYPIENSKKGYERDKVERAFEMAERYSRMHGFRIYNATRGGTLETFERVNFDSIFY